MRVFPKKSRPVLICIPAALLIVLVSRSTHHLEATFSVIVPSRRPSEVWNFVSELQHKRITNPSLSNIEIVEDSGGQILPNSWRYKALLTETIPLLGTISIEADYEVEPAKGGMYAIFSTMSWCKLLFCVDANSTLMFSSAARMAREEVDLSNKLPTDTLIKEALNIRVSKLLLLMMGKETLQDSFTSKLNNIRQYFEAASRSY